LYTDDLLSDEALAGCSIGAFGLWIKLLCLMHKSTQRGYLKLENGKPFPKEHISRICGCSIEETDHYLEELIDTGACSVTGTGIIYNRRMVREESKRIKCVEAGRRGGNPALKGHSKGAPKGESKGREKGENIASTLKGDPKGVPKGHSKGGSNRLYGSGSGSGSGSGGGESPREGEGANGRDVPTAEVLRLAALAHEVFPATPPNVPSTIVCSNVRHMLEIGRNPEEIERLFSWRRATRIEHVAQSPQSLSDPEKFDQWWTMMIEESRPKRSKPDRYDRNKGTYNEGKAWMYAMEDPKDINRPEDLPDEARELVHAKLKAWNDEQKISQQLEEER